MLYYHPDGHLSTLPPPDYKPPKSPPPAVLNTRKKDLDLAEAILDMLVSPIFIRKG